MPNDKPRFPASIIITLQSLCTPKNFATVFLNSSIVHVLIFGNQVVGGKQNKIVVVDSYFSTAILFSSYTIIEVMVSKNSLQ